MKLDRHDRDEDHERNARKPRPPVFDTSLTGKGQSVENDPNCKKDDISNKDSNRLTKAR